MVVSVVNWNTPDATIACVRALLRQNYPNFEVVVIDNGSTDNSVSRIRSALLQVAIFRSDCNLGFAAGHRLSVDHANATRANGVWLVNSDAIAEPDALMKLVSAWVANGDHVFGGLPIVRRSGHEIFDFPEKYLDPNGQPKAFYRDRVRAIDAVVCAGVPQRVSAVVGSSMLIPMNVIAANGFMSDAWFMHCEEIDYCYRLRSTGTLCYLVPQSRIHHEHGGSHSGRPNVANVIAYYRARNEIQLTSRYASRATAALVATKKLLRAAALLLVEPRRAKMIARGALHGVTGHSGKTIDPDRALRRDRLRRVSDKDLGERQVRRIYALLRRSLIAGAAIVPKAIASVERHGQSKLAYSHEHVIFTRQYYLYCIALFAQHLQRLDVKINLLFGDYDISAESGEPFHRIDLQCEHTLVKPGGRDSEGAWVGTVPLLDGEGSYLVRLSNAEYFYRLDTVIEYSQPNIENLRLGGQLADHLSRTIYVAPLLYECNGERGDRDVEILTTFADTRQPRRAAFLLEMSRQQLAARNVRGVYESLALRDMLDATKILVNVHQTDHHHTLEELRVLPALLRGVIVVSETVPLCECVPYRRFVVWSRYEDLPKTVADVHANYDEYRERIFGGSAFCELIAMMRAQNETNVALAVDRLVASRVV